MSKPRLAMWHRQPTAVGYYRTIVPARWLSRQGYEVDFHEEGSLAEEWGKTKEELEAWARGRHGIYDLVWTDRCVEQTSLGIFSGIRHFTPGCRLVVDFDDDFLNIPDWNQSQRTYHRSREATEISVAHLRMAELATVSTETLAEEYKSKVHRVVVVKNAIDPTDWEGLAQDPERKKDPNLRVLYGGAGGHYGDMDVARRALEKLIREPPVPWRLIVFGAMPSWLHVLRRDYPERVIGLPWVQFEDYPQAIAWGGFDLALAPLQEHPFNEAKCLVGDTRVMSQGDGMSNLRRVSSDVQSKKFHLVWQNDGFAAPKAAVTYENVPVMHLRTKRGYALTGTPNHRLRCGGDKLGIWRQLREIKVGDTVDIAAFEWPERHEPVRLPAPLLTTRKLDGLDFGALSEENLPTIAVNRDWALFLGIVLGDGTITAYNRVGVTSSEDYPEIPEFLRKFAAGIGLHITEGKKKDSKATDYHINSRSLRWWLAKVVGYEGPGRPGHTKNLRIPDAIWRSSREVVAAFLRGLIETDGTVTGSGLSFTTKSLSLAQDVQVALLGFGIMSSIGQSFNKDYNRYYSRVSLGRQGAGIFQQKIGFLSVKKCQRLSEVCSRSHSNAYKEWRWEDEVVEIEGDGSAVVYDLQMPKGAEHYWANGFVSHNSNIKWQECAVQRIPLVCSDVGPYDRDIPAGTALKVAQSGAPEGWEETLRAALTDPMLREKTVEAAWQAVHDEWVVDRRGHFWETAIEEALSCPRIESMEDARLEAPAGVVVPSSVM